MTDALAALQMADTDTVTLKLTSGVGRVYTIPLGFLTFFEWKDCGLMSVPPTRQKFTTIDPKNRKLVDDKLVDIEIFDEAGFSQAWTNHNNLIAVHRVIIALEKGGGFPKLAALSIEKKIEAVESLDASVARGLAEAVMKMTSPPEEDSNDASTFRILENGHGSVPSHELDSGDVDEPA